MRFNYYWKPEKARDDRTCFLVHVAICTTSVRLAALCHFIAACRCTIESPGIFTAKRLGHEIGVGHWRIRQLLKEAADWRVLGWRRTVRGFQVWVREESRVWLEPSHGHRYMGHDIHSDLGHYRLSAAKQFGVTASVLLEYLDPEPRQLYALEDLEGDENATQAEKIQKYDRVGLPEGVQHRTLTTPKALWLFPWMKQRTVEVALERLAKLEWIERASTKLPRYKAVNEDDFDQWTQEVPKSERGESVHVLKKSRWSTSKAAEKANRLSAKTPTG